MVIMDKSNTEEIVERDELIETIKGILQTLKQREQLIIQLYYFEELSLKEISSILNISESRISQIHKKLIIKIRQTLGSEDG
jgi:RNA polymerase sigma factor for flagellar operon FliA